MRRLGKVMHVSRRGAIILRTEKTPPIGAEVVDKSVEVVGTVTDIFGPVKQPYVAIRAKEGVDTTKLVGQLVYLYRR
ncbi:MAG: H/ACA RNA-protein complex protein Gar1 [Candidatus Thorarchaeota archaeon]|nr:MAG: H/ACA RNA-protein complex protein Gar1 [Candidatus Thorarchaeota archaeon]